MIHNMNIPNILGGIINFYVNGIKKGTAVAQTMLDLSNLEHINLGHTQDGYSTAYFGGMELRETVLREEEIAQLYNRQLFCHSQWSKKIWLDRLSSRQALYRDISGLVHPKQFITCKPLISPIISVNYFTSTFEPEFISKESHQKQD